MKAQEMFNNMGYVLDNKDEEYIVYKRNEIVIGFRNSTKSFVAYELEDCDKYTVQISFNVFMAIQQQIKELSW